MDIKDYLRTFSSRDYEIQKMKEYLVLLKGRAVNGASPKLDGMPRSNRTVKSSMEGYVCKALDLESQIREKEAELEKDKRVITDVLQTLVVSDYKTVIVMRYFQHYSWRQIAQNMGYSLGWVYRIHGEALDQLRLRLEVVA